MAKQRPFVNNTAICVIIPTLNEERFIGKLLADVYTQTRRPDQVLIVDGHSTDKTKAVVEIWAKQWSAVQFLKCPTRGVGAQRDFGGTYMCDRARKQKSDPREATLLYFFDADVRLPRYFLKKSSEILHREAFDAACPQYVPSTNSLTLLQAAPVKVLFAFLNFLFWFGQKYFPAGAGPCIIVTAQHFKKLGGFTTSLLVDDLDFVHRAGSTGRFTLLDLPVFVSTRRFAQYGVWQTFWQYVQISWYFVRKNTHSTNKLKYEFGNFKRV
jgi:glycosyltransferase involved in cell wall biosynthesis